MSIPRSGGEPRAAWTGKRLGGKESVITALNTEHLAAIDGLLARTRYLAPQAVTRTDFSHPLLDPLLAEILDEIANGRGVVVIQGLSPDRYDAEQFERIYWGFGTHWGNAAVQSLGGDRLGRVRSKPGGSAHTYQTDAELVFHTDPHEIIGLMCVEKARSGGESELVSAIAIHDQLAAQQPDLLAALYRGFPYAFKYTARASHVTDYEVPVFSAVGGCVSCVYVRGSIKNAAKALGQPIPMDLAEGLDAFNAIADDPDTKLTFVLEPGEILMVNNFTVLHSRRAFEDTAERRRYLLRMWLDVPAGRPVIPAYSQYIQQHHIARLEFEREQGADAAG